MYRNGQLVYEARYDAFGNRVWAKVGTEERYYLYEGDVLVAELDRSGNLIAEYVWGLLGPVARVSGGGAVQLYVLDGLGHVRALVGRVNNSWQVTDTYAYDSWGNLLVRTGTTQQPFTWNGAYGYEYVPATGLYHVGVREYDPRTGRWLQRDPIDAASGDPNLYRYAGNEPIRSVDPDGLAKVELCTRSVKGLPFGPRHAFIIVTDEDGTEYYFRAGPSVQAGPGSSHSGSSSDSSGSSSQSSGSGSSNSSGGSSNSSSPGSNRGGPNMNNGRWGPVRCDYGRYENGEDVVDWVDPEYRDCITLVDDDKPASYYLSKLKKAADDINKLQVPYNPLSTNSNAAAHEMLKRAGIPRPKEIPWWLPGWGTKLPAR